MPSENNLLETIEHYLLGTMPAEEKVAFERRLKTDETLSAEVEAYRSILTGFNAVQMEDFKANLRQWDESWESADQEEIEVIFWYLTGKLGKDAGEKLELKIKSDAAFANKVGQYRTILEGFGAIQMENFANLIKQWDTEDSATAIDPKPEKEAVRIPLFRKLAVAATVLILLFAGAGWYFQSSFSDAAIIAEAYKGPRDAATMGKEVELTKALDQQFRNAHKLFQQKQYTEANAAFNTFVDSMAVSNLDNFTRNYYLQSVEWTSILARIGAEYDMQTIKQDLSRISTSQKHSYRKDAATLLKKLESMGRQFTF